MSLTRDSQEPLKVGTLMNYVDSLVLGLAPDDPGPLFVTKCFDNPVDPCLSLGLDHDDLVAITGLANDALKGYALELTSADSSSELVIPLQEPEIGRRPEVAKELEKALGTHDSLPIGSDIKKREPLAIARIMLTGEAPITPVLGKGDKLLPSLFLSDSLDLISEIFTKYSWCIIEFRMAPDDHPATSSPTKPPLFLRPFKAEVTPVNFVKNINRS